MPLYQYQKRLPVISPQSFIFDSAVIIGDVTLHDDVSIWSGVTIRGDNDRIEIQRGSNVQESCVLHVDPNNPLLVGPNVTIGHQVVLHGCSIGEGSLVGIGAIVLNKARIGRNCLIGAGAIIPEEREIPEGSLVVGVGKIVRQLSSKEIADLHAGTANYVEKARAYSQHLRRIS